MVWHDVRNVVPWMTVKSLFEPLLIQIMTWNCNRNDLMCIQKGSHLKGSYFISLKTPRVIHELIARSKYKGRIALN